MNSKQINSLLRRLARRGISWITIMTAFQLNPLVIVDINELASMDDNENQIVYPDKHLGAYVIFEKGGKHE
jgi:hypothetical protein